MLRNSLVLFPFSFDTRAENADSKHKAPVHRSVEIVFTAQKLGTETIRTAGSDIKVRVR